jgi:biopolymer transport protein ExbB
MQMAPILDLWNQASLVWEKGGILMPALAALSLYTYYIAFDLWFRLRSIIPRDLQSFPREKWGAFQGGGRINQIMHYCLSDHQDAGETKKRFEQVRTVDTSYLNRRLRFLMVLATASPLIGLLGTVGGMLRTFDGLSMQDSYKMDLVASGISEALVTTQAGLLVAIPALAFSHLLKRKKKDWLHCVNRLESISLRQLKNLNPA